MYLPTKWHSLSVLEDHGNAVGFISSQALHTPENGTCSKITRVTLSACPPLTNLNKDGVLITLLPNEENTSNSAAPLVRENLVRADERCRAIGGDSQMTGWGHSRSPSSVKGSAVKIDVCLRDPSQQTRSVVTKILMLTFP
ncbi:hypothetical protein ACSHXN_44920 (plasmid) [Streptomyces sp. HUAS TT11]|uniref:hypothetical protein n=1 Tax=Streptomyces sp. HUAS TT11 TaxID=3447508 RepID=UPI003F65E4BF